MNEYTSQRSATGGGLHHRNLKQLKQSHGKGGPGSQASRPSAAADVFTENKKRREQAPSQLSKSQAAKVKTVEDVQSVITADRLR